MREDLRHLLHLAAAAPRQPLDLDGVLRRGLRRRRGRRIAVAAAVVLFGMGTPMLVMSRPPADGPAPRPPATVTSPAPLPDLAPGWSELPPPPEVRHQGATAWTGQQLLMWGGRVPAAAGVPEPGGYLFDIRSWRWSPLVDSPLAGRLRPASAWTGRELLIWGGTRSDNADLVSAQLDDGAAYDPARRTWRRLPPAPIGPRAPLSVWTGQELIVWGTAVRLPGGIPTDGAAYRPATNSWRPVATAPVELTDATAVWTGDEMIVFGAALDGDNLARTRAAIGAAYDPATDTWRRLPDAGLSPQASTAVWAGGEMIAWDYNLSAAGYDPQRDRWRPVPNVPLHAGECRPHSTAAGDRVFAEYCGATAVYNTNIGRWHDVSRREFAGWWFELLPAGPATVLLGYDVRGGASHVLVYRPPA
jgi:hypothetical protein